MPKLEPEPPGQVRLSDRLSAKVLARAKVNRPPPRDWKMQPMTAAESFRRVCFAVIVLLCGIVGFYLWVGPELWKGNPGVSQRTAERERAQKANEAERVRWKCISSWSGSLPELHEAIKEQLHDPKSFEHISSGIGEVLPDGRQKIDLKYRARNAFGAMRLGVVRGWFDNESCRLLTWEQTN